MVNGEVHSGGDARCAMAEDSTDVMMKGYLTVTPEPADADPWKTVYARL